jgi:hypothetical protein
MTRARDNANNWAADITGVTAGTGITGGGTSGTVTVTNEMVTTIDAKGDLVVGSGADAFVRVPVGTNNQVLTADSATTSGVKWATADALPSQTGNSGKYLTTNGTTASWGTVNQPLTWTPRLSMNNQMYSIGYNGSNLWVAAGDNGWLFTSADGITWTSRDSGFNGNPILKVTYANSLWVAGGSNGIISTSTDGTTWTTRTSNMSTNDINSIAYGNSTWVAVGGGGGSTNTGGITYSTDGITWTRKSQSVTTGTIYYDVAYNGTNWIVGTNFSTNNHLYASSPSGTWTAGHTGSSGAVYRIIWDGTRHITYETSSYGPRYSTSTTLGTTTSYAANHNGLYQYTDHYILYNSKVYLANGYYLASFTPASTSVTTRDVAQQMPGRLTGSSPFFEGRGPGALWVGAQGYIWASDWGIYTSF